MNRDVFDGFHPSREVVPVHVGIIPDGSRRWAVKNRVSYYDSYDLAMKNLCQIMDLLYDKGVDMISLYFSSRQNFERPDVEIEAFCKAESNFCDNYILPIARKNDLRVTFCGDRALLPRYLLDSLTNIEERTRGCTGRKLNLCVAYNPLVELWESSLRSNSPDDLVNNLWISQPVDLTIRTGNANLISNFLLLQSGFARLYFVEKLINDISKSDIEEIMDDFYKIERKYGE